MSKKQNSFAVAPSPFNPVKLELGIVLLLLLPVWLLVHAFVTSLSLQFLYLAGFGVASSLWLLQRIRRIQSELKQANSVESDGISGNTGAGPGLN